MNNAFMPTFPLSYENVISERFSECDWFLNHMNAKETFHLVILQALWNVTFACSLNILKEPYHLKTLN